VDPFALLGLRVSEGQLLAGDPADEPAVRYASAGVSCDDPISALREAEARAGVHDTDRRSGADEHR
jgi:hypothetical protein